MTDQDLLANEAIKFDLPRHIDRWLSSSRLEKINVSYTQNYESDNQEGEYGQSDQDENLFVA
jgi:hypothetical protein